jgi:Tfp pilus assembly protein PilW
MLALAHGLRRSARTSPGFSLVELVVACLIGGLALAVAWSWLFTSAAAGGRTQSRLEAATSLAFVERLTAAELRRASRLLASPSPGCSTGSLLFEVTDDDGAVETVSYVWNPATRVLWRKAAGSHLASGVTGFTVAYFDGAGAEVVPAGGSFASAELARVRRLRLTVTLASRGGDVAATWDVTPRAER